SSLHAMAALAMGSRPLVHGDVAPCNVIIGYRGVARLIHSGLSAAKGRSALTGRENRRLPYKAPEQLRSGVNTVAIDPAADLFSVGVLMWELLTGRRLFDGPNESEMIDRVLHAPIPSLATVTPEPVPEALTMLVDLALQRDREKRPSSALDFA